MNYFEKADMVDPTKIANEYTGMYLQALNELTVTRIQLQQHIDREQQLMKILKENAPEIYQTLVEEIKKGDKNGGNS